MANKVVTQKLIDNNKRTLLKVVVIGDGSATANASLIRFKDLNYAINATGYVTATNPQSHYEVSVKRIYGYGKFGGGYAKIQWEDNDTIGNANTEMVVISNGSFDFDLSGVTGDNAVIRPWGAGETANCLGIIYTMASPAAGDIVDLFIDLRKSGNDYDQGQSADPTAFNAGWTI